MHSSAVPLVSVISFLASMLCVRILCKNYQIIIKPEEETQQEECHELSPNLKPQLEEQKDVLQHEKSVETPVLAIIENAVLSGLKDGCHRPITKDTRIRTEKNDVKVRDLRLGKGEDS